MRGSRQMLGEVLDITHLIMKLLQGAIAFVFQSVILFRLASISSTDDGSSTYIMNFLLIHRWVVFVQLYVHEP